MNLIVDIGNTRTKLHVFDAGREVYATAVGAADDWLPVVPWDRYPLTKAMLCSVRDDPSAYAARLSGRLETARCLSAAAPLPVRIAYRTPETLGADRLAAVCGAWALAPGRDCLVVDLGTAITYDFLSRDGVYRGGNIAPGLRMRMDALHRYTARLPQVAPDSAFPLLGDTTESAVRAGVMQGVLMEMEGYARALSTEAGPISVFLTGGDAFYFEKRLKSRIFVTQNLVAVGLNAVLEWNEKP